MNYILNGQRHKYFFGFIQLIFAFVILTSATNAATYVVTNTSDSGLGSLRQAILNANANPGADFITFGIPGAGVHEIKVGFPELPTITDTVNINGTTQPGYTNHPLITIRDNFSQGGYGLRIESGVATIRAVNIISFLYGVFVDCAFTSTTCESNRPGLILKGSRIGTNPDGSTFGDVFNGRGVYINGANAASTQIGGTGANDANVISHNSTGIEYVNVPCQGCSPNNDPGRSHLVVGNKIGTNFVGTDDISNKVGIKVGTNKVTIGGDTAVERNVISGNKEHGIWVLASNAIIEGNYVGTNAAGTAAVPNLINGILVSGANNVHIGGATAGTGNVISGNGENGVAILPDVVTCGFCTNNFQLSKNNLVYGNRIGTNAAGTAKLPNAKNGISINAEGTIVGETETGGAANTISGNTQNGVFIFESEHHTHLNDPNYSLFIDSKDTRVQRNYIGTNETGANLGNGKNGVLIDGNVTNTIVGGNDTAQKNLISFNGENGVSLIDTPDTGADVAPVNNQITLNDVSANALKGISIYSNDAQGIDSLDADEGSNTLLNHPKLEGSFPSSIVGKLDGLPNKNFIIHFYANSVCEQSGRGEGKTYLGAATVATDANGIAAFKTNFGSPAGSVITATATESRRAWETDVPNTSEFSNCVLTAGADPGGFSLDSATYATNENGNSVTVTVNRTGGTLGGVTVNYSITAGTATVGKDFVAHSSTLTFAAGQTTKTFAVPILEDNTDEAPETVNIALSNPSIGASLNAPSAATLTINDNDQPPQLSIANVTKAEGNQNTTDFNFVVTKTGATEQSVTVNYQTVGATATNGVDYSNTAGTLTIAANETSKTITVPIFGELTVETDETFKVVFSAPINAALSNTEAMGTILDDDNPGKLEFSAATYATTEKSVFMTAIVTRKEGSVGTVTIDYAATANTATPGDDFAPTSGKLVFLDGETTKQFQVTVNDDQSIEQTESFNLILSNPTGGAFLGAITTAVVNIADDDVPATTTINGTVAYGITGMNQPQKYVPGVEFQASGATSAADTTDSNGAYELGNLTVGGQYTVTATKNGNVSGITAFDATLVLRHVASGGQGVNTLSGNQLLAADTDGDNSVTAFDATQILRYVAANGANANTGKTGNWKFLPASRNYQSLGNSLAGENYEAILIGELNGDWTPPAGSDANSDNENTEASGDDETGITKSDDSFADAEISFPIELAQQNGEDILIVPVMLTNYAGRSISAYSFEVGFNSKILQLDSATPIDTGETISQGAMIAHDVSKPGLIGIAAAACCGGESTKESARAGVLLKLRFKIIGNAPVKAGGITSLNFRQDAVFEDNEGVLLKVKRTNGSIRALARGFVPESK